VLAKMGAGSVAELSRMAPELDLVPKPASARGDR